MKEFLEKYDLHETSNGCLVRPRRFGSEVAYVIVLHLDGSDAVFLGRELHKADHEGGSVEGEMWEAAKEFFEGLND